MENDVRARLLGDHEQEGQFPPMREMYATDEQLRQIYGSIGEIIFDLAPDLLRPDYNNRWVFVVGFPNNDPAMESHYSWAALPILLRPEPDPLNILKKLFYNHLVKAGELTESQSEMLDDFWDEEIRHIGVKDALRIRQAHRELCRSMGLFDKTLEISLYRRAIENYGALQSDDSNPHE